MVRLSSDLRSSRAPGGFTHRRCHASTLIDCKSRPKRRLQAGGTRFAVRSEGWVPASPGERLAAARGRVCRAKTAQRSMTTDFSIIEKHLAPSCALKRFSLIYDLGDGTTSCDGSWSCDAGCVTNVFASPTRTKNIAPAVVALVEHTVPAFFAKPEAILLTFFIREASPPCIPRTLSFSP